MKTIQKNLRLPQYVVTLLEKDAESYGYSFGQYVKHILVNKVEDLEEKFSQHEIKNIQDAWHEYKKKGAAGVIKDSESVIRNLNKILYDGE